MSLNFPSKRLEMALVQLEEAEKSRIHAAHFGVQLPNESTTDPYAECSYTLNQSRGNRIDNRWGNILTYDHSLLPGAYLNAALIPPPTSVSNARQLRSYIASQAPLPHTLSLFYSHILNQGVKLIVNLTSFRENNMTKAHEYWPLDSQPDFVTEKVDDLPSYTIRQVERPVLLDDSLSAKRYDLEVTHNQPTKPSAHSLSVVHVTSWADFGDFNDQVFSDLLKLIEREAEKCPAAPVWVHCSAGVGRSGTVIGGLLAKDIGPVALRKLLHMDGPPRTPSLAVESAIQGARLLIDHERRYRPKMVQTPLQFGMVAGVVGSVLQENVPQ